MRTIELKSKARDEMIDITSRIQSMVPEDMTAGLCHVFCEHTTAGLTVNENCDPDVRHDLIRALDRLIPQENQDFRHAEGNSAAHLKASLTGCSLFLPVCGGSLSLGRWQGIYFCEFDGPRIRRVAVQFIESRQDS